MQQKKRRKKRTAIRVASDRLFFELFELEGSAEEFWKILKLALIADNDNTDERDRGNTIFFYDYTKELFENIYTLLQEKKKADSKKPS